MDKNTRYDLYKLKQAVDVGNPALRAALGVRSQSSLNRNRYVTAGKLIDVVLNLDGSLIDAGLMEVRGKIFRLASIEK